MSLIARDHPSVAEVEYEDDHIISVYNGLRIPTGRRVINTKGQYHVVGEKDPSNSRLIALMSGNLKMSQLSDDEVQYGIPRCDDGMFSVKAAWQATHLPNSIRNKLRKELYIRADRRMNGGLLKSIDTIMEFATQPYADDKVRFEAAKYVLERLRGKTPEVIVHSQDKPWEIVYSEIQRGPRPAKSERGDRLRIDDGNIEEAEIVED